MATHGQEELARAGAALVGSLVDGHPALVIFDDLHWADGGAWRSSDDWVVHRIPAADGHLRPEEVGGGHPLARLLNELDREIDLHQLPLVPLTADEVRQFLQEVFGEAPRVEVVDRLHRRTRGDPFFLEELVIATREGSWTGRSPSAVGPPSLLDARLPWTTSEAVLDRLEGLDPSSRELLQSVAVVGDPFDLPSLGTATGWADPEVLPP